MQLLENLGAHTWLIFVTYVIFLLDGAMLDLKWADFSCKKGPYGKYFRFCRPLGGREKLLSSAVVSRKQPQTTNSEAKEHGCGPAQLCLQKQAAGCAHGP